MRYIKAQTSAPIAVLIDSKSMRLRETRSARVVVVWFTKHSLYFRSEGRDDLRLRQKATIMIE